MRPENSYPKPDIGVMQITYGGYDEEDRLKAEVRGRKSEDGCQIKQGGYSDFKEQPAGPNTWPRGTKGEMLNAKAARITRSVEDKKQ